MTISSHELSLEQLLNPSGVEPVEILMTEHRITEQALNCLERMAERWSGPDAREKPDYQAIQNALVFFGTFVEAWHFHREEVYFASTGVRLDCVEVHEGGDVTFHDHQRCSRHLRGMRDAVAAMASWSSGGDSNDRGPAGIPANASGSQNPPPAEAQNACREFGKHARAYVDILLKHIENEEDLMYPIIERHATPAGKQAAAKAFRLVSGETIDSNRLGECLEIVSRLAERFHVTPRGQS